MEDLNYKQLREIIVSSIGEDGFSALPKRTIGVLREWVSRNGAQTEEAKRVFVVHGHDDGARETVARFLEKIGLTPVILHEQPNNGRTIIEKLEGHSAVGFAVVLLTPDDFGRAVDESVLRMRARQNVVLELGVFCGVLKRSRVCALIKGEIELPSDYLGIGYVPFDHAGSWKLSLAREMKASGLPIDLNALV